VGGVQPIEYMLDLRRDADLTAPASTRPIAAETDGGTGAHRKLSSPPSSDRPRWHLTDSIPLPGMDPSTPVPRGYPFAGSNSLKPNPRAALDGDGDVARLRPLATPLMTSGFSSRLLDELRPVFEARGIVPLQAGGVAAGAGRVDNQVAALDPSLKPGSVLAVPLLTGDVDMTAIGTCTEVVDGHVFGFGHPFMSEGPVALPMGTGRIHTVIANLMTSFKIGSLTAQSGAIYTDQLSGVAGRLGPAAPTVPIELRVKYADGRQDQTYHFAGALHAKYTPLLSMAAFAAAVTGEHDLPQFHTLDYDLTVTFANGKTLRTTNTSVNTSAAELFFEVGAPMMAAADNPFERVLVRDVKGTVTVTPEARESTILSVQVPRLKHRPGETLKAYVTHRPFRSGESLINVEFPLPRDLPEGQYQLVVSDWQKYLSDEQASKPFKFTAESIGEVFDVMRDVVGVRHDALYVRLVRQPDGVAIGRTAMPNLPSSRREVLAGAGRSDTTPFVSSTVKTVPTQYVMAGEAQFVVTIDKDAHVEVGGRPGARPDAKPEPTKAEESRKAPTADEAKPKPGQKPDQKPEAPAKPDNKPDAPTPPGASDDGAE
jgi:hypothetical protein